MSSNIVLPASFDVSEMTFRAPKVLDSGGKIVSVDYSGRQLMTQSPSMIVPYGLNVYDKAGPTSYSVDLSFRGVEENPKLKTFHDMLVAFDERLINAGVENSLAWFKMPNASREVIKAFYTPSVKLSFDSEGKPKPYPPTLKVKLPKNKSGSFETLFYDSEKRPYEGVTVEDLLLKGSRATLLIKCTGLWFAGSKFGASWKAVQCKMDSVPSGLGRNCAIQDDDEESVMAAVMPTRKAAPAAPPAPAANDDDDDEEEEEEEEVVEAPVVPKKVAAPVKKVVKKAATGSK